MLQATVAGLTVRGCGSLYCIQMFNSKVEL